MNIFKRVFASVVPLETNVAGAELMTVVCEKFSDSMKKFQFNLPVRLTNLVDTSLVNAWGYAFQLFENAYEIIYI